MTIIIDGHNVMYMDDIRNQLPQGDNYWHEFVRMISRYSESTGIKVVLAMDLPGHLIDEANDCIEGMGEVKILLKEQDYNDADAAIIDILSQYVGGGNKLVTDDIRIKKAAHAKGWNKDSVIKAGVFAKNLDRVNTEFQRINQTSSGEMGQLKSGGDMSPAQLKEFAEMFGVDLDQED